MATIFWDPNPVAFRLPGLGYPIAWYGVLFAVGFALGCWVTRWSVAHYLADDDPHLEGLQLRRQAAHYTDRLLWFTVIGTVVGARLGHVFFYNLSAYLEAPLEIFNLRRGGLTSHGAVIGVTLSLLAFRWSCRPPLPRYSLLRLLDIAVLPTALIAVFVRVGNFINQELIGIPSGAPWAVKFAHPLDGATAVARHPVQLYEALAYLGVFVLLRQLSRLQDIRRSTGLLAGLFFLLVFGARFLLEFFKETQSKGLFAVTRLDMGQLLSIPLVALGLFLVLRCLFLREERISPN